MRAATAVVAAVGVEAREVEPEPLRARPQVRVLEPALVGEQRVVHRPERALAAGRLGRAGRRERARMRAADGEVAERDAQRQRRAGAARARRRTGTRSRRRRRRAARRPARGRGRPGPTRRERRGRQVAHGAQATAARRFRPGTGRWYVGCSGSCRGLGTATRSRSARSRRCAPTSTEQAGPRGGRRRRAAARAARRARAAPRRQRPARAAALHAGARPRRRSPHRAMDALRSEGDVRMGSRRWRLQRARPSRASKRRFAPGRSPGDGAS